MPICFYCESDRHQSITILLYIMLSFSIEYLLCSNNMLCCRFYIESNIFNCCRLNRKPGLIM